MRNNSRALREIVIFAMLGTLMFASRVIMQFLPNIHLIGALIMIYTLVFRCKALIPLYIYIFLEGIFSGFATWWIPYLYVWTVLWGITMLLPKKMPEKVAYIVYPIVCMFHGSIFGILYAPGQALLFGLDYRGMLAWIAQGLTFDILHLIGNLAAGFLVLPLTKVMCKLRDKYMR